MNRGHGKYPGGESPPQGSFRGKITFAVFLAIASFFLLTEHRAHAFGFLPYLLLLACPLMHLFHHGGHGHGGHRNGTQPPQDGRTSTGQED